MTPARTGDARLRPPSSWFAVALVGLLVAVTAHQAGVGTLDLLAFTGFEVASVLLPGVLAWRALRGEVDRPLLEDLTLGGLFGHVLLVPTYVLVRWLGAPQLVLAVPVVAVAAVALRPRTRPALVRWRGAAWPRWHAWLLGGICAATVLWVAANIWAHYPLTPGSLRTPYLDEGFQLALVGELEHHVPGRIPFVVGEPLHYHWFLHADLAATAWGSHVEPIVLLRVLGLVPVLLLTVTGLAVTVARWAGRTGTGVLAAALAVVVATVDLLRWTPMDAPVAGGHLLSPLLYLSPTQTFGTAVFVLALFLTLEWVRGTRPAGQPGWVSALVLLAVLLVLSGSKPTYLPMMLAGVLGAVLMALLTRTRPSRRLLGLGGLVAVAFAFGQGVLYHGESVGTVLAPFDTAMTTARSWGLASGSSVPAVATLTALLVVVAGYLAVGAGVAGALVRGGWRDPAVQLLGGMVAAGTGAAYALSQLGSSQLYFLYSTTVPACAVSAWGLQRLADRAPSRRSGAVLAVAGLTAGTVVALLATATGPASVPVAGSGGSAWSASVRVAVPWLLAAAAVAALALLVALVRRRRHGRAAGVGVFAVAAVIGLGAPGTAAMAASLLDPAPSSATAATGSRTHIGAGGVAAARWLRGHSTPDDLVATNAHCATPGTRHCSPKNFWVSGYTERRVLVEGWLYTPTAYATGSTDPARWRRLPFWNAPLLRLNDRAFRHPSPASVAALRDGHGVRWLLADLRYPARPRALSRVAHLRFSAGDYRVYELTR